MKKSSTFDHVLYIYHKDSLMSNSIFIRKSRLDDMQTVEPLFANLLNRQQVHDDTLEAITQTASRKVAFSVFCDQSVILNVKEIDPLPWQCLPVCSVDRSVRRVEECELGLLYLTLLRVGSHYFEGTSDDLSHKACALCSQSTLHEEH